MLRRSSTVFRAVSPWLIPLLMLVALWSWSLASPVGSSPDDDFHLPSIWCGLGDRADLCEDSGNPSTKLVPTPLATTNCYAFLANDSGECWNPDTPGLFEADRVNTGPLYPPVFYGAMGVFASPDVEASVVAMRFANSLIAVGLITVAFWALPRRLRPALILSVIASAIPLGIFVYASTNPSSWALLAAATVWIGVFGATQTTGRRRLLLALLAVIGTVMGAGARADAGAFAIFGAGVGLLLGVRSLKRSLVPLLTFLVVGAIGVGFYLSAGQSGSLVSGLPSDNPPLTRSQLIDNAMNVPNLWTGALGGWGLGWLDTPMPSVVSVCATVVASAVLFIGIRRPNWREASALLVTLAALWAVPFILLAQSRAVVGTQVQPRYILPLIVILLGVASVGAATERQWTRFRRLSAAVALAVAFAFAIYTNVRRYTTGLDGTALDPGTFAEWWWPVGPTPMVVITIGTVAFSLALAALALLPLAHASDAAASRTEWSDPTGLERHDHEPTAAVGSRRRRSDGPPAES
ncbi:MULTISPECIES: DUF2142 domain-containing protein [unclassified Microbacterium]|uniref:DUF2142 domain-containing protein n=1 Tax=unclassified Microbacterium TaxID=2609290 RepID=UPI000A9B5512|nr:MULTISPECIES: DUF2142 domain-containing protein [unclassified Microbacterium]MCJ1708967.1 DUF2142 domain-containing protein [Microbacterium sp. VKM Ac-2923]